MSTTIEYDPFSFLIRTTKFKPDNTPLEPPLNAAITRCVSQTDCGAPTGNNGGGQRYAAYRVTIVKDGAPTQAVWYDVLGREVKKATRIYDPSETVANLTKPWMMSFTVYDPMGTVLQQSTPHCPNASDLCALSTPRWTVFAYDALGRVISKRAPGPTNAGGTATTLRTTYAYSGGETAIQNGADWADGANCTGADCRTMYRYQDARGQLMKTVDAASKSTRYWTDALGKPVAIVDAKGSLIRAEYNAFGYRTKSVDPNQGTWNFTYDGSGQVLTQTDARGVVTTFVHDTLGRMTSRTALQNESQRAYLDENCQESEEALDAWTYDGVGIPPGALESVSRQITKRFKVCNGQTLPNKVSVPWKESYRYDNAARVERITTSIVETAGQPATDFKTDFEYDQTYNREKVREHASGLRVQSTYNVYGMPHRLRDADLQQDYLTIDRRDHWGNITQQTYGNFTAGLFAWNPGTGQSQQRLWKNGGPLGDEVDRLDYTYDVFGNLSSQSRSYPDSLGFPASSRTESYTYDSLHRLKRAISGTSEPIYGTVDYTYDDVGNLLAKTDYSDAFGTSPGTPYQYTSSKPNAVTSVRQGGVTRSYGYDENGNLTTGAVQGWYDPQNLSRKLVRGSSTALFDYTPNGERYREREDGVQKLILPHGMERLGAKTWRHELGEVTVRRDI
ncbi:MAG TPA: hypothetical protein VJ724_00195, partial [Tahibacter sp.]|nr:hypothetical protein [Tahibacter sp.]